MTLSTEMIQSSQTWKKFREKTCKVLQIHSHNDKIECLTCQQLDKQTLPNKALCFVTISSNNEEYVNVNIKSMKNSLKFDVDNHPQDYVFANKLNDEPYHSKPFLHEALISTKEIAIGRPPIPLRNIGGNDCYAISGMCYFTNTYIDQNHIII